MLASLKKRSEREDEGFTLIELMVVVLIIAILLAIAIPTFLGARERAQNRAAQSDIRNALAAEKVFYTDAEAYTATTSDLLAIEPSLKYAATASKTEVGVTVTSAGNVVCLSKLAGSGKAFSLQDTATAAGGATAGTKYYDAAGCSGTAKDKW